MDQDFSKAVYWFRKAANQGHANAQYLLGLEYTSATGVDQDFSKAVFWFRKAANQGHADAKFELDKLTAAEVEEAEKKQAAARSSIMQMIDYAADNGGVGHESEIQEVKRKIEASPKPAKGNKKAARKINDQALALLNTQDFSGAVAKFVEANRLDASDIEIVNNLGFAYLKQKNLESAQQTLIAALTMFPDRAAAWSNLGEVFALGGDERKAVACYANTYRFSKAIYKTHQFMKKMNADEYIPALKQAREAAMVLAEKMHPELIVTVPPVQKEVTTPQAVELPQEKLAAERTAVEARKAAEAREAAAQKAQAAMAAKTPISTESEPIDAEIQNNLGTAFFYGGDGTPQDYSKALYWYQKAADQGLAKAQTNLGFLYANGQGVPKNYAQAAIWYRKAADQGYAKAQDALNRLVIPSASAYN